MNKSRMMKLLSGLLPLVLVSCTYFMDKIAESDERSFDVINLEQKQLSLVFSHNISGETHPCGCRHFPLGGLPQVAGQISELKKQGEVLYVDTGDMLFPSSAIPESLSRSLKFAGQNLAKGLNDLGLKYIVPGDQDLAGGADFLKQVVSQNQFKLLVANWTQPGWPLKRWVHINIGPHKLFLTGLIDPQSLSPEHMPLVSPMDEAMKQVLSEMKDSDFDAGNPFHRLIVLSHSGIDTDKSFAQRFPEIDWIVGSHSQSFLKDPQEEGKTKIVQVLSRNHYLGEVRFNLQSDKKQDSYIMHEVREGLERKLEPNPYIAFINQHKAELDRIRIEEQQQLTVNSSVGKLPTAASCLECHQKQADHWMNTSHAIAYATLIRVKESNNLGCVECHSVGLNNPLGFSKVSDMVVFAAKTDGSANDSSSEPNPAEPHPESAVNADPDAKLAKLRKNYWAEINQLFAQAGPVRQMTPSQRKRYAKQWLAIDSTVGAKSDSHQITHNFANVQCLNCHDKPVDHPFDLNEKKLSAKDTYAATKQRCLQCHTTDQSPEWYEKKPNGLPGNLNELAFLKEYQRIACPKKAKN